MKTRCALQLTLIALLTLCLNLLFASDLEMALLDIEITEAVQNFASGSATASTNTDDRTGSNSSNASTTTAVIIGESDSNLSTNTPPKPHNPHTALTIDDTWTAADDEFVRAFLNKPNTTTAFLNQLNRSLQNEWGVKTWVGYLALGTAYGYYGWRDADYAQMSEIWSPPTSAFYCPMDQATFDKMYYLIFYVQSNIAFSGKLAYGAIGECLEWAGNLAKRYEVKLSNFPKVIKPNADFTAIETNAYGKSRLLANTAGLALAGGSALVDAKLYKHYLSISENVYPYELTFLPLWLGAGLTLDNFNDVLDLTHAGFAKLCKTQTGVIAEQRQHLKELFAKAQYHLQISTDSEIENIYNQFTAAGNGTADTNIDQLQLLTAAGANTALPSRWKRNLATNSMAAVFTLANIYNWWVLGNGILDLNVTKVDPTAASAILGTLNVAIFAPLTYAGMVQMGNSIIDTFAPKNAQLPHANHRSESNMFKRGFQALHVPAAFTLCAAGAVAATSFSLYFTLYPELPFIDNNNNTLGNYSDYNYTADGNSSLSNATEYDSCAGYYHNDISFFYNQPWYMVQTATFLIAANSRPVAKALQIMRAAPTKIADAATGMYNKVRSWCGYENVEPEITAPQMRDTMMEKMLTASAMLKNANDTTITSLHSDLNAANLPQPQAKPGWVSWAKQLVGC